MSKINSRFKDSVIAIFLFTYFTFAQEVCVVRMPMYCMCVCFFQCFTVIQGS